MRRQDRYTEGDQSRGSDGRSDDVVRRGRYAHTEDQRGDHGAEEKQDEVACGDINKSRSQLQADTCLGDDADDHTGGRARDQDAERTAGTFDEAVNDIRNAHAGIRTKHGRSDGNEDTGKRRFHRGVARSQKTDDGDQRNGQMSFFFQDLAPWRELASRCALQVIFFRFEMYPEEYPNEVENGRNDGSLDDFHIGDTDEFRHQESGCAHDRRHQLATGRSCRFYGTSEILVISQFLHHRDGEGAGTYDVRYRGTGDRTLQSRGNDSDLSWSAGCPASDGIGNIDEEFPKTCLFQIRTEKDEEENEGGGNTHRDTKDALCREEEVSDHLLDGEPAMCERPGEVRSEEPIRKEAADNNDDRKTYDTASRFDDHHDAKHPDHGIRRSDGAGAQDELLVVHKNVNGGDHRKDGKCHVDRMETPLLDPGFLRRAEKIDEADAEGQVDAALDHRIQCAEKPGIDLEEREANTDDCDDFGTDAFVFRCI